MKLPYKLSVRLHRLERALTRPVRNRLFRTVWKRNLPVAMVTATHGKTTTTRMLGNILAAAGHTVGISTTDGIYIDGRLFREGDYAGYYGARWVFRHKEVTAAVLETAFGGLSNAGLFVNQCDAGALVNVHPDHIRPGYVENLQQLLASKRVVPDAARSHHVLNLEDDLCVSLLPDYDPAKVIGFSIRPDSEQEKQVLARSGQMVTLDRQGKQVIHIAPDGRRTPVIGVTDIAATCDGLVSYNVENALAAVALGIAMKAGPGAIAAGLAEVDAPFPTLTKRFRLVTDYPFKVVYDRVNGPVGFAASLSVFDKICRKGQSYGLLTVPGRQPGEIVRQFADMAASRFDHVVCFELEELRGRRGVGEVAAGYADALIAAGLPPACVETADTETGAFELIASKLKPGDIIYIQR